jgi:hypothetical protein
LEAIGAAKTGSYGERIFLSRQFERTPPSFGRDPRHQY